MKEKQILVIRKEPGKSAEVEPLFENTLEAFQAAVGGHIEAVTVTQDLCILCNETACPTTAMCWGLISTDPSWRWVLGTASLPASGHRIFPRC